VQLATSSGRRQNGRGLQQVDFGTVVDLPLDRHRILRTVDVDGRNVGR
jgi:hypothetical protein